jgi:hypothetical protein
VFAVFVFASSPKWESRFLPTAGSLPLEIALEFEQFCFGTIEESAFLNFTNFHQGALMRKDAVTNFLLLLIAVALIVIAARPYIAPSPALAQSSSARPFYIEPGVQMLRNPDGSGQVYGKVVVDLRTGKIWGFPTGSLDPYPSYPVDNKPAVSRPFALGKFVFEDTDK